MNIEQERADFEAFASKHGLCVTEDGDLYRSHVVAWMWKAWQARAALQSQDREDAERYRWLRDGGNDDIGVVMGFDCIDYGSTSVVPTYREGLDGEHLDAAIDHARRIEGEA